MNLFPHALMREMGFYIFFIRSELKCGFGDFKASWEVWRAGVPHPGVFGTQQWPWASPGSRCHRKESRGCPAWCWPLAGGPCSAFIPAAPSSHLPFSVQSLFGHLALKTRGCNVRGDPPCCVCALGSQPGLRLVSSWRLCWGWFLMCLLF